MDDRSDGAGTVHLLQCHSLELFDYVPPTDHAHPAAPESDARDEAEAHA